VRHLIVNGDDFGISHGVSRGIVEAHRRGILTSTSLMVNRPAAEAAAALARECPALSVGLHLELEGAPGASARAAVQGQVDRFDRLMGAAPTHLDSHHDVHRNPSVLPHVFESAGRLGIPVRGHSPVALFHKFYGRWGGETHAEQVGVASLLGMLETEVGEGVTELICHPGYPDAELVSSYALERECELRTLCDPRVRQALDRAGIRLVGFRDLAHLIAGVREERDGAAWPR
jgi:predicted glycoside hydrolase/deacetylase ChbG (UPF0249 family)